MQCSGATDSHQEEEPWSQQPCAESTAADAQTTTKVPMMSRVPANATVSSVPNNAEGFVITPSLGPAGLVMAPSVGSEPAPPSLASGYLPYGPCGSMSQDEAVAPPVLPRMPQVAMAGQPVL